MALFCSLFKFDYLLSPFVLLLERSQFAVIFSLKNGVVFVSGFVLFLIAGQRHP